MPAESRPERQYVCPTLSMKSDKNIPLLQNNLAERKCRKLASVKEMILQVQKNQKLAQKLHRKSERAY